MTYKIGISFWVHKERLKCEYINCVIFILSFFVVVVVHSEQKNDLASVFISFLNIAQIPNVSECLSLKYANTSLD